MFITDNYEYYSTSMRWQWWWILTKNMAHQPWYINQRMVNGVPNHPAGHQQRIQPTAAGNCFTDGCFCDVHIWYHGSSVQWMVKDLPSKTRRTDAVEQCWESHRLFWELVVHRLWTDSGDNGLGEACGTVPKDQRKRRSRMELQRSVQLKVELLKLIELSVDKGPTCGQDSSWRVQCDLPV